MRLEFKCHLIRLVKRVISSCIVPGKRSLREAQFESVWEPYPGSAQAILVNLWKWKCLEAVDRFTRTKNLHNVQKEAI